MAARTPRKDLLTAGTMFEQAIGDSVERRKTARYQLRVPVIIQWNNQEGARQQGGGFSRDISTGGVFVLCNASPPTNTAISLEVLLPPLEAAAQGLRLQAGGEIVRVEETGFAAAGDLGLHKPVNEAGG